jgi:hypothetical protein
VQRKALLTWVSASQAEKGAELCISLILKDIMPLILSLGHACSPPDTCGSVDSSAGGVDHEFGHGSCLFLLKS